MIERKKLQPIEGAGIAKLYLRLKNKRLGMYLLKIVTAILISKAVEKNRL